MNIRNLWEIININKSCQHEHVHIDGVMMRRLVGKLREKMKRKRNGVSGTTICKKRDRVSQSAWRRASWKVETRGKEASNKTA